MKMFLSAMALGLALAGAAQAQAPAGAPPIPDKDFATSADVQALIANAKKTIKPDQPNLVQRIVRLAPHNANLEYRVAKAPAALHVKDAELFYVIEGAGTAVTGGTIVNQVMTGANASGPDIQNGLTRPIAKGDFLFVPENTPHQITEVKGAALILLTVHIPRGNN